MPNSSTTRTAVVVGSTGIVGRAIAAWKSERNPREARIHWTFTLAAARQKLRKLYPSNEDG
jgi:hypothetical protein